MSRFFVLILVLAAVPLAAQTASDSINVSATNAGIFTFTITETDYDFGTISSLGGANALGTEALVGVPGTTDAVYTSSATAINWNVSSAPQRTVRLHNSSGAPTLAWGTANSLELNIPDVGVGTTCGFKGAGFTGAGLANDCTAGNLYHSMTGVGRGGNSVDGNLQLRVTVDDADLTGLNTWVIQITASAP